MADRLVEPYKYVPETGFRENAKAAAETALWTDASYGPVWVEREDRNARDRRIYAGIEEGLFPSEVVKAAKIPNRQLAAEDLDTGFLAQYAVENIPTLADIDTDEIIRDRSKQRFGVINERNSEVMQRAGVLGKVGQFAGAAKVALTDPIYFPAFFLGVGSAAQSARILSAILRPAVQGALVEGGLESIKQAATNDWKYEIGADHSLDSALRTILFSAGMGGAISGVSSAAAHVTLHTFANKAFKSLQPDEFFIPSGKAVDDMAFRPLMDHVDELRMANQALGDEAKVKSYQEVQQAIHARDKELNGRTESPTTETSPTMSPEDAEYDRMFNQMVKENPDVQGFTEKYLDDNIPEVRKATDIIEEIDTDITLLEEGLECLLAGV